MLLFRGVDCDYVIVILVILIKKTPDETLSEA